MDKDIAGIPMSMSTTGTATITASTGLLDSSTCISLLGRCLSIKSHSSSFHILLLHYFSMKYGIEDGSCHNIYPWMEFSLGLRRGSCIQSHILYPYQYNHNHKL